MGRVVGLRPDSPLLNNDEKTDTHSSQGTDIRIDSGQVPRWGSRFRNSPVGDLLLRQVRQGLVRESEPAE